MTASAAHVPRTASAGRVVAIDLARWLAIVGMMSAHLLSSVAGSWTGATDAEARAADVVLAGANGNASSLFAVLAGVSLVLASRSLLADGRRTAALRAVLGRAIVVGAVGVVLAACMPPVYVVLNYLAFAMVVAAPLLLAPSWVVGAVAVALWLGGSQLALAVRQWRFGDGVLPMGDALEGSPLAAPVDLLATGEYPAVTWVAMLAVGILVARAVLAASSPRSARLRGLGMLAAGTLVAVAAILVSERVMAAEADAWAASRDLTDMLPWLLRYGTGTPPDASWWWQATSIPHTGTIGDVARGVGVGVAVVGALVALLPPGAPLLRALAPVRAAGAAPFTIYALHVCALLAASVAWAFTGVGAATEPWFVSGFGILAVHVAGSLLVGAVLARMHAKGPLERIASAVARAFAHPRAATPVR
ncbi:MULTISPECIES: heparan-alpha-glucosaminide N-acetyltransferase domain-containing protein [unclassified Agrococcus]|uniref:heparan-alpha-glucosaminide N-acetyltransferase domain-containing protein n=1 Tax=unclassified Agrococcus TaxID=2615065 RepID=UPI003615172A